MCNCAELMKAWEPTEWDYIWTEKYLGTLDEKKEVWCILPNSIADSGVYGLSPDLFDEPHEMYKYDKIIWLPRQDQLQEITQLTTWYLELYFHHWFLKNSEINTEKTMEQLWLSFMMKQKFNKTWDGKNWIKS